MGVGSGASRRTGGARRGLINVGDLERVSAGRPIGPIQKVREFLVFLVFYYYFLLIQIPAEVGIVTAMEPVVKVRPSDFRK